MRKIVLLLYIIVLLQLFLSALSAIPKTAQVNETKIPGAYFGFPTVENIDDIDLSRQYAFFIGIDRYKNINDLYNSVNDGKTIEALLDERYGFKKANIMSLYDAKATKEAIQAQFKAYVDKLTHNDTLLIYFSGHGYKNELPFEKVYWLPEDVGTDLNQLGRQFDKENEDDNKTIMSSSEIKISDSDLKDFLKNCQARHIFIVMDSCHSSVLFKNIEGESQYIPTPDIWNKKSRQLLAAGDSVFDGPREQHSPFAAAFISILQREEPGYRYISASQVISEIKKKFPASGQRYSDVQVPEGGRVFDAGDNEGEFYFYLKYEVMVAQTRAEFERLKNYMVGDSPLTSKLERCTNFLEKLNRLPTKFLELKAKEIVSMRQAVSVFLNAIKSNEKP
ncbi:MAG: caspase family protein [Acidobacteria bacterium]|nr:caspase family protein [Acidobacteriota bacterium]